MLKSAETILNKVPLGFQNEPDSQRLKNELLLADPSLQEKPDRLGNVIGLIMHNNRVAKIVNDPRFTSARMRKQGLAKAYLAFEDCVDGRTWRIAQIERVGPSHSEPAGLTKRSIRNHRRKENESGGRYIPRSPSLRGGIQASAKENLYDLLEFPTGHFMGDYRSLMQEPSLVQGQQCGQLSNMQEIGEMGEMDLIQGGLAKLKEITVPGITDFYNDWREIYGFEQLKQVCVPLMLNTENRAYILGLENFGYKSPLDTAELLKIYSERITSSLGYIAGEPGFASQWFTNPDKLIELAELRYDVTKGILNHPYLEPLRSDILSYFREDNPNLTNDQLSGSLYLFASNVAMLYELADFRPMKWHDERCIVISPGGNPPFSFFPDVQTFVATPPEPERTVRYAATMVRLWQHHYYEAQKGHIENGIPEDIIMFLTTPVYGNLEWGNDQYRMALANNGELSRTILSETSLSDLQKSGKLHVYSLLYDYGTREIRNIVVNRVYS